MNKPNQDPPASTHDTTEIERAEKRMQQAEVRTDQANTRTEEANTRTDQANTRTDEANTRTHEANTRTEHEVLRGVQAILASEIRYRRLFETAQDGIIILDADTGQVVDANPFMKHLLGYSQEEFLGKKLWEIGPFKGAAASKITFAELQRKDLIRYEGLPLETKDGRRVEVEFVSNCYFVDQKRLIQCNIRDMTQTKKSEARFRRLVDSNAQGVCFWNVKGGITGGNNAFLKLVGYTREDLEAGRISWAAMTPPDYAHLDQKALEEIAATGVCAMYEKEWIRKDRSLVPILLGAANFEDDPDEGVAFVLDLTARKKLEAEFRQSQKMEAVGLLAGGVAHDFNNILAVIQLQVGLMHAEGGLSPRQSDFAEEIGVAAQRAAGLSHQLLLFSRKETMQTRDLDLNQSINDMTKMLRRILGENIQIQFKFAPQSLPIHADSGMMNQVLINLALNSRDALPKGGLLVIETYDMVFDGLAITQATHARLGSFVCLSVSDNGCGIPPEILPRIFEPFFTTKDVGKGTGLGLATVFGIVQQHQGWINVYSETGLGTTFRIYFPKLAHMSEQKPEPSEANSTRGGQETILLVEDDVFLHASMRQTLLQLGYRVLEASTGIEAQAVWKDHRDEINLLLTDLVMPGGVTGIDLAQRLIQENPKLKVIYMSGYSAEVVGKDSSLTKAANFLTKPFPTSKLAQTIRDTLDHVGQ